ncbi:MAG: insulinase family protein [Bacteroidales bacterium]|jgi:predicted Zn-dependent peptidase|nr:insulinase family protein [Bacteroidales bacterium]
MINRRKLPKIFPYKNIHLVDPEKFYLDNGIKIFYFPNLSSEIVKIDIIFGAGSDLEKNYMEATFASTLIKEAPVDKNPDEISEFFDFYGCVIETFVSFNKSGIRLNVPKQFVNEVIKIFAELILTPAIPRSEFEILKNRYIEAIKTQEVTTKYVARNHINAAIFGKSNPRGKIISIEDVENLNLTDVKRFVSDYYVAKNCICFVSGAVDNDLLKLLNKYFGNLDISSNWNKEEKIVAPVYSFMQDVNKNIFIEVNNSVQATIYMANKFSKLSVSELIDLNILNTIFGGYFGSRLMKNIREDKGYTYGIGSFLAEYDDCVVLKIVSDVGIDFIDNTVEEVFNETEKLCKNLISKTELEVVRNYMLGEIMSSVDGIFNQSEVWKAIILKKQKKSMIQQSVERIKNITATEIRQLAKKYLKKDDFFVVVAGNVNKCKQ